MCFLPSRCFAEQPVVMGRIPVAEEGGSIGAHRHAFRRRRCFNITLLVQAMKALQWSSAVLLWSGDSARLTAAQRWPDYCSRRATFGQRLVRRLHGA